MKKLAFLLAIVIGFSAFTAMKADLQPDFKFTEEIHDFGKIVQGKPVTVQMTFTNVGDQPLIISAVEPTCGCTVAKYTQTPIKKDETGTIVLTYNAAAPGNFNKGTTIKSNAKTPIKVIYIKGEVIAAATTTAKESK
jgi:hypothetical protein